MPERLRRPEPRTPWQQVVRRRTAGLRTCGRWHALVCEGFKYFSASCVKVSCFSVDGAGFSLSWRKLYSDVLCCVGRVRVSCVLRGGVLRCRRRCVLRSVLRGRVLRGRVRRVRSGRGAIAAGTVRDAGPLGATSPGGKIGVRHAAVDVLGGFRHGPVAGLHVGHDDESETLGALRVAVKAHRRLDDRAKSGRGVGGGSVLCLGCCEAIPSVTPSRPPPHYPILLLP